MRAQGHRQQTSQQRHRSWDLGYHGQLCFGAKAPSSPLLSPFLLRLGQTNAHRTQNEHTSNRINTPTELTSPSQMSYCCVGYVCLLLLSLEVFLFLFLSSGQSDSRWPALPLAAAAGPLATDFFFSPPLLTPPRVRISLRLGWLYRTALSTAPRLTALHRSVYQNTGGVQGQ